MSMWMIVAAVLLVWAAASVAVALIVGRAIRTREHYEAPLYPPTDSLYDTGAGSDLR